MNFRIWTTIREMAPGRFFVTVSALSADDPDRTGGVETGEADSREKAHVLRDHLATQLGTRLQARGHSVIDVRDD